MSPHVEPEMIDLLKIVIPKVMNEWEYIAYALHYEPAIIESIKEKKRENPKKCCEELLKDWLTTNNGAKAGPKVWLTLLNTLKINEISDETVEDITTQVKELYSVT